MGWEETMFAMFDDLEQQAEGLALAERDAAVAELTIAEYAQISLASRLHASLGREVRVRLSGGLVITGRLARVGEDWMMVVEGSAESIIDRRAVVAVSGLSARAASEETWGVVDRLTLRALLRRLAAGASICAVQFVDGQSLEGRVGRVGRDFLELHVGDGRDRTRQVVPLASVAVLRGRD